MQHAVFRRRELAAGVQHASELLEQPGPGLLKLRRLLMV
jgi:hypothetical protein